MGWRKRAKFGGMDASMMKRVKKLEVDMPALVSGQAGGVSLTLRILFDMAQSTG